MASTGQLEVANSTCMLSGAGSNGLNDFTCALGNLDHLLVYDPLGAWLMCCSHEALQREPERGSQEKQSPQQRSVAS